MRTIYYRNTASGVHGIIAGQHHAANTKEELLTRAQKLFPNITFELNDN